jgi:hypothetical protein
MNAIKTENLDVYALVDKDLFVVSVLVDNVTLATFEYPIADLAKDVVASLSDENGEIIGEDADDAYETIEAFEAAMDHINAHIVD